MGFDSRGGSGIETVRLNHIRIAVYDYRASRDWYVRHFGFRREFENPRRGVVGLLDDAGNTLILEQAKEEVGATACILYLQVGDVDAEFRRLRGTGVPFVHRPSTRSWGYGAELLDPSGYRIGLWDQRTMDEKG